MPKVVVALLVVALVLLVLRARPLVVLGVYAVTAVVVPGPLGMPFTHTSFATVHHVLVLAGLARLVLGLIDRSLSWSVLRPTRVHAALGVLLVVSFGVGIAGAVDAGPLGYAGARFADVLDQLGFFVVCLALVRQVADLRKVLAVAALALLCGAALATVEHLTGRSWGVFLFSDLAAQRNTSAAFPLSARAGTLRVRGGAEFALQFGWLIVTLLPALVVTALSLKHRRIRTDAARLGLAAGAMFLACLVVYWSFTRTALAATVVALLLTALLARQRLLAVFTAGAAATAGLAFLLVPSVSGHLDAAADIGAIDVRADRLGPVMDVVSYHPVRGVGLGGLITSGFGSVDNALLLHYVELGAIGVVALLLVLAVALAEGLRPVLVTAGEDRLLAAAAAAGVIAFVASSLTYDAFTLVQGVHLLWFLVALAIVLGERRLGPRPVLDPRAVAIRATVAGLIGLVIGLGIQATTPGHVGQRLLLTTLTLSEEALPADPVNRGTRNVRTACGVVEAVAIPQVTVQCVDKKQAAGVGQLRVVAPDHATLVAAVTELTRLIRDDAQITHAQLLPLEPPRLGRSSLVTTAPVWASLGLLALFSVLPLPSWPRRRAPERGRPPTGHVPAPPLSAQPQPAELVAPGR